MPQVTARRVVATRGECSRSECQTGELLFACPTKCPSHKETRLFCSEQCFVIEHANSMSNNQSSPATTPRAINQTQSNQPNTPNSAAPSRPVRATRVGKYQLGRTLGQGTFGKVKYAINLETREAVALKMMDKARIRASNMGEQIKKEIAIMKTLNHPNVIRLVEVLASQTTIYFVMELVNGGELYDMVIARHRFSEDEARHYFRQLISGLAYCHKRGVYHRDLKPENLLLDDQGVLKISDFGLSALEQQSQSDGQHANPSLSNDFSLDESNIALTPGYLLHTTCGTPNYVAPEVLMDKGYDGKSADVWSAGVILYVLLAGHLPFDEVSMVDLFRKIVKAEFSFPDFFSADAIDLLTKILNPNPDQRATMADIQQHPWFTHGQKSASLLNPLTASNDQQDTQSSQRESQSSGTDNTERSDDDKSTSSGEIDDDSVDLVRTLSSNSPLPSPRPSPKLKSEQPGLMSSASTGQLTSDTSTGAQQLNYSSSQPLPRTDSEMFLSMDDEEIGDEFKARAEAEIDLTDNKRLSQAVMAELTGARKLNAFDLINMAGGAAMNRMFQRTHQSINPSMRKAKLTQFTSSEQVPVLVKKICAALDQMNNQPITHSGTQQSNQALSVRYRDINQFAQIRVLIDCLNGMKVMMIVQIYELTPELHLIECSKMKGDLFLYYDCYKEMRRLMQGGMTTAMTTTTAKQMYDTNASRLSILVTPSDGRTRQTVDLYNSSPRGSSSPR